MLELNQLYNLDCIEGMKQIDDKSIDLIICDLPYGQTKNSWDVVIPFHLLWEQYNRIIKDKGVIVLFGQGMFTAEVMMSNPKMWRYNLIWDKKNASGYLNANRCPLRSHEDICVFYKSLPTYNPQFTQGELNHSKGQSILKEGTNHNYGKHVNLDNAKELNGKKYPKSIIQIPKGGPSTLIHPTQKPIPLLEWLIKTFSNEDDTILDNCAGSSSTLKAAQTLKRNFIGFEINPMYYELGCLRLYEDKSLKELREVLPQLKVKYKDHI